MEFLAQHAAEGCFQRFVAQQVADAIVPAEQAEHYAALREKRRASTITAPEQATLDQLSQEVDLLTVRKAYAAVLLKWRGHRLPALAELEAQP